VAEWLKARPC